MKRLFATLLPILLSAAAAAAPPEQPPGQRIQVLPGDLPAPYATPSKANHPRRVKRPDGAVLRVPDGFEANLFATGLRHPRWLTVAANGDVLLSEPGIEEITLLRDTDGDGVADIKSTFLSGFRDLRGLAIHGDSLYIADLKRVWRLPYRAGDLRNRAEPRPLTAAASLGDGEGHWSRLIAFAPDGRHFYVTVGSIDNIGEEPAPRATVQRFDADGGGQRTFAGGLRNPVGIAFRPGTAEPYVVVNERDGMGDDLVPDFLTRLVPDGFYGWPYAYIGANPHPGLADKRPDLVAKSIVPDLLFEAHSSPLGLVFYDGDGFPAAYRGDAFVALHGSWNAATPRGYTIVRVPFEGDRPAGHYEIFASGFWDAGSGSAEVWGRPAGLAVAADGSLLVADDWGGAVWRISYTGTE